MSVAQVKNVGKYLRAYDANASENSGAPSLVTAAGTGDNTKRNGQTIDRYNGVALARSAQIITHVLAALGASETVTLAHEVQYSADGSSWDTAVVIEAATQYGASGAGNKRAVAQFDLDLSGQKRYFRINVTPNLSASATDTCTFATVATLGGYDVLPQ